MSDTATPANTSPPQGISQPQIDALKVLINTAHVAQARGALTLKEAPIVSAAVDKFIVTDESKPPQQASSLVGPAGIDQPKIV